VKVRTDPLVYAAGAEQPGLVVLELLRRCPDGGAGLSDGPCGPANTRAGRIIAAHGKSLVTGSGVPCRAA